MDAFTIISIHDNVPVDEESKGGAGGNAYCVIA